MLRMRIFPVKKGVLLVVATCALAFCSGRNSRAAASSNGLKNERTASAVILKIEGRAFSNRDFRAELESNYRDKVDGLTPETLSRLFDGYVDGKIIFAAARKKGLTLTPEEKREYWTSSGQSGTGSSMRPEDMPDEKFEDLLVEKYIAGVTRDVTVMPDEINAYYESHKKDFLLPERVKVSQIVVPTEEKAVEILRRIKDSDEEGFRKAAAAESSGPEAASSGVMGVFKPGELPKDMEKVIFGLSEGEVSRVVESPYGYHIFRLDKKYPPQLRPVDEVAERIKTGILGRKVEEAMAVHLKGLKDTLDWRSLPENLFFTYRGSEK